MKNVVALLIIALTAAIIYFAARGGIDSEAPTEEQKLWALATCGVLTERNWDRHSLLGGKLLAKENIAGLKRSLKKWWGVENRKDLLESLEWVREEGHREGFEELGAWVCSLNPAQLQALAERTKNDPEQRNQIAVVLKHYRALGDKSLKGWDYSRYVALCGWGYVAGYLSEKEAWRRIMPMARVIQKTFDSWRELGENYLIGRAYWSLAQTQEQGQYFRDAVEKLCSHPDSPWVNLPWDLDLGGPKDKKD